MIRQMFLATLFAALMMAWASFAEAAAQSEAVYTKSLFARFQTEHQDDLAEDNRDPKLRALELKIAEKINEFGLREMTARDHGISQSEFLARKARSQFGRIYFDVKAQQNFFGKITFDFIFARGSDFFIEDEKSTEVRGCQAINDSGVIKINLERCLRAHAGA